MQVMSEAALSTLREAFSRIHREVREGGSEFDFRYSLVDHLFTDALGWSRTAGDGHVTVEEDRKDVLCFDDSDPPFPVVVCETKRPSHELELADVEQLETYMTGVGSGEYGVLTNGREFRLYEYQPDEREIRSVGGFDIETVATATAVDGEVRESLELLTPLHRDRFVDLGDGEFFRERAREVPVQYQPGTDDEGYDLFVDAVKDSLDGLTAVMVEFFEDYRDRRSESYPREFLDSTFPDWKDWREYTGKTDDAKETFCRETAYIVLNRALFARIAEDKEIVGTTRLSGRGMAEALERDDERPYLDALMDTYDRIDDHYADLYELGIFDWWWVARDKRQQFTTAERRRHAALEDELDYTLRSVLRRLNRFDFEYVNRDILGRVYEDYLPKQERKELGEYYTPIAVVRYMLDSAGYTPNEDIGNERILDPACGSGGFLTEAVDRLIEHYLQTFGKTSVHRLDAEEARTILDRAQQNIYGIDINPFAVHITQINLLFRTIDLYDTVTEADPYYSMDGFEIHVADTLSPTAQEKRDEAETNGQQVSIREFAEYNGRAQSFIEDRNEVDHIKDEVTFDVVVANPPYVKTQNITGPKGEYADRYESVESRSFDIYVPFVERGLDWVAPDGSLAYICPNRLTTHEYAERIREMLADEPITRLIDFTDVEVFDAATPYPCIVTVDRAADPETDVRCARLAEEREAVLDEIQRLDEWETPDDVTEYELFVYPKDRMRADNTDEYLPSWKPMPDEERTVFDRITDQSDRRLRDIAADVFVGIQTSANPVYLGSVDETEDGPDGTVQFHAKRADESQPIEQDMLRRVIRGPEVDRWGIDWEGLWLVFPYEVEDGEARLYSREELRTEFGHTWEFLKDHRAYLEDRDTQDDRWWAFGRRQNVDKMGPDKIITNIMSEYSRFTVDADGEYTFLGGGNAGGYGIRLSDQFSPAEYFYVAALLNSSVVEFWHKQIAPIFGGKYFSYNKRYLEPHPVVLPDETPVEAVVESAREITRIRDRMTDLEYETDDVRNYLTDYDRNVTLVDLADSVRLSDDDYRQDPIRTDETADQTEYRVVMKRGHYLSFDHEAVRDFVFELVTAEGRRLPRSELLTLPVPETGDVVSLMEAYRSDRRRIEELRREFESLRRELDETVLRDVYELDADDASVVERFLEVW